MTKTYFYTCIGCSVLGSIALLIFAVSGFWNGAVLSLMFDILMWCNFFALGVAKGRSQACREILGVARDTVNANGQLVQQVQTMKAIIEAEGSGQVEHAGDSEEIANSNI